MTTQFIELSDIAVGLQRNLDHMLDLCDQAAGQDCDLLVFPEFTITKGGAPGLFTLRWTREEWLRVALRVPGPEMEAIGAKAREKNCHIVFSSYVQLPDWPGHFINAGIIVGPSGQVICLHWKAYSGHPGIGTEYATTAYEVLNEFVARYGWDQLWPVAVTNIGNLAVHVCSEGHHPEVARALAFNGTEILCYSISGGGAGFWRNRFPTIFRGNCASNLCWGIYANNGAVGYSPFEVSMGGSSMVVDPCGQVVASAKGTGEEIITATIPIAEFRTDQNRYDPQGNRHLPPGTFRGGVRREIILPVYQAHEPQFPPNLYTQYQSQHHGQLPPDAQSARRWFFDHARWKAEYHDPAENI
jgi:formamidase